MESIIRDTHFCLGVSVSWRVALIIVILYISSPSDPLGPPSLGSDEGCRERLVVAGPYLIAEGAGGIPREGVGSSESTTGATGPVRDWE